MSRDDIRDPSPFEAAMAQLIRAEKALEAAKLAVVREALRASGGNRRAAAKLAGVHERTVHRWIVEHPDLETVGMRAK